MASRSCFHLLWIHAREGHCWLSQEFYLQFLEGPPYCSASWPYQLHSRQQCTRASFPPHPPRHWKTTFYGSPASSRHYVSDVDVQLFCYKASWLLSLPWPCSSYMSAYAGQTTYCPSQRSLKVAWHLPESVCSGVERPTFNSHCQCQREGQVLPSQTTLGNTPRALHLY